MAGVALVAGSSRGIGKAAAEQLLRDQFHVCVTGRTAEVLEKTHAELAQAFGAEQVMSFSGDLTAADDIAECFRTVTARWGKLTTLVANLGSGSGKPGWDQPDHEWDRLFRINFFGSAKLAQAAIPFISAAGGGAIVFISSITGLEATGAPLPYSAAKAALINYSKNLSRQVAARGIRVNCIAPGNVLFPGGTWERNLAERETEVKAHIEAEVPLHRFGRPEEIAELVGFLCGERSTFMTGSCVVMDGGQTRSI